MNHVGIVIISHSEKVTIGIQEILHEVLPDFPIGIAGGSDDGEIGTSVEKIMKAIDHVDHGQGTLLFYDLGSAKMNAELVIDMKDTESIKIVEAPLLEGAYVGAVESNMGKTMDEIIASLNKSFPPLP
ncbi:MAG TPA: dihydroxyacetone kinase phosphoryl donor subunit DhaM [Virgibacillus sp.]|nr:dihydroxyacetone kinase phosphoryl donor subunit DhaM [Virgibacillus sp.]